MTDIRTITPASIVPLSLADAPTLIERLWPAQKISAEAQKERKAVHGQTLTALGSYWKGRKPLVLVRACILGALLPATSDGEKDLATFETLMRMDDASFGYRDLAIKPSEVAVRLLDRNAVAAPELGRVMSSPDRADGQMNIIESGELRRLAELGQVSWRRSVDPDLRAGLVSLAVAEDPYREKVARALRPEEIGEIGLSNSWASINSRLGTQAQSVPELVEQLGVMRFGRRPRMADTFSGGGSIPFEGARCGCDAAATDLNPIACMLSWGALNIVGAPSGAAAHLADYQQRVADEVEAAVEVLGIELDDEGNRAKAYLYCVEVLCPQSGWRVPVLPSLVISKTKPTVARLVPNPERKDYDIIIDVDVPRDVLEAAEVGTFVDGQIVHHVDGEVYRTSIKSIRGDYRTADGRTANNLRQWDKEDVEPRSDDIIRDRLYCIQWMSHDTVGKSRPRTFFAAPTDADLRREAEISALAASRLAEWQARGLVPTMRIDPGEKTEELTRTRGWTWWHHLFNPRHLVIASEFMAAIQRLDDEQARAACTIAFCRTLNYMSKLTQWIPRTPTPKSPADVVNHVFYNMAFNTFYNYGSRPLSTLRESFTRAFPSVPLHGRGSVATSSASTLTDKADIYITDPPYADAVNYHELTEYFIAWVRGNVPAAFADWTWDSRRPLAIKGEGEAFRREMVAAYRSMAENMPDNGIQIVMFTHQSGSVWADLAQIFWGAGLQVQAAWYIATETTSEIKKGGYVQGTVILVLRKRLGASSGYEDEIVRDVRDEVARQIDTLVGLNQSLKGAGRVENLFEDSDLQMAGYAAALRVLTGYTRIDGRDMTVEALRPRRKGETGFVDRMIDYAVSVANEHMVPDGVTAKLWQQLRGPERFYLKMVGTEAGGVSKLDNYQNFARAFRVSDYMPFMASLKPNAARLKSATDFGARVGFDLPEFGDGIVRAVLFAMDAIAREVDVDVVLAQLRDIVPEYYRRRADIIEVADYLARRRYRDDEGRQATILANRLRNERL